MRFEQHLHTWAWRFGCLDISRKSALCKQLLKNDLTEWPRFYFSLRYERWRKHWRVLLDNATTCPPITTHCWPKLTDCSRKSLPNSAAFARPKPFLPFIKRYASMYGPEYVTNTLDIIWAIVRARFSLVFWWFLVNHPVTIPGPCRLLKINSILKKD